MRLANGYIVAIIGFNDIMGFIQPAAISYSLTYSLAGVPAFTAITSFVAFTITSIPLTLLQGLGVKPIAVYRTTRKANGIKVKG